MADQPNLNLATVCTLVIFLAVVLIPVLGVNWRWAIALVAFYIPAYAYFDLEKYYR